MFLNSLLYSSRSSESLTRNNFAITCYLLLFDANQGSPRSQVLRLSFTQLTKCFHRRKDSAAFKVLKNLYIRCRFSNLASESEN